MCYLILIMVLLSSHYLLGMRVIDIVNLNNAISTTMLESLVKDDSFDVNFKDEKGTPIISIAIDNDNESAVKTLLRYGADVNTQDQLGRTPLMHAAQKDNISFALLLLYFNADKTMQDYMGRSSIDFCKETECGLAIKYYGPNQNPDRALEKIITRSERVEFRKIAEERTERLAGKKYFN